MGHQAVGKAEWKKMRFYMLAECCESFAGTDVRGETIQDSRSGRVKNLEHQMFESVCLFVCPQHNSKTKDPKLTQSVQSWYKE